MATFLTFPAPARADPPESNPSHHNPEGGFFNPYPTFEPHSFADFLHFMFLTRRRTAPDEANLALAPESIRWKPEGAHADWEVAWVGHSTLLVKIGALHILTDPIWSDRASPVGWAGPTRAVPPGIPFEQLPKIDAVVISHNHYDHLDADTIDRLQEKFRPIFFVPLGVGEWMRDRGIDNVVELDWWQTVPLGEATVHCLPAQHFTGRNPFNQNQALWAGWGVQTPEGSFFFAGDTGYHPEFVEIGRRLAPIRLAALPIGAYDPRKFMRPMHMDPTEAVQALVDLKAAVGIGIHWGTFRLANDPLTEAPRRLEDALRERGISLERFWVFKHGEGRAVPEVELSAKANGFTEVGETPQK